MNEQETQSGETDQESRVADQSAVQHRKRKHTVTDFFSRINLTQLTLALMALMFMWQWMAERSILNDMQQQLAKKIAETESGSKADRLLVVKSLDQQSELYAKVAMLETRNAELQNQRAALESLYNDLTMGRDETVIAEVEQMLLYAEQQLQMSANVKAALVALQLADTRLQRMKRPSFNGLRNTIARDMERLRALPSVDIIEINHQLTKLIGTIDGMTLAYQQRVAGEPVAPAVSSKQATALEKMLHEIGEEARQLVRIENTGKDEIPVLLPSQQYFLRENLKQRLLSARIALLSREEDAFKQELRTAQQWTERYFDGKSQSGSAMLAGLKKLSAYSISVDLPNLGASLQAVNNYRLTHDKAAR